MAGIGVPIGMMGAKFDIDNSYFKDLTRQDPVLRQAIEKGKQKSIAGAASWMYRKAFLEGDGNPTLAIFWMKTQAKWNERIEIQEVPSDTQKSPIEQYLDLFANPETKQKAYEIAKLLAIREAEKPTD